MATRDGLGDAGATSGGGFRKWREGFRSGINRTAGGASGRRTLAVGVVVAELTVLLVLVATHEGVREDMARLLRVAHLAGPSLTTYDESFDPRVGSPAPD